jgi:hypothetical protein
VVAHAAKPEIVEGDRFLPVRAVSLANRLFHHHRLGGKKFAPQNCSMGRTWISLKGLVLQVGRIEIIFGRSNERAAAFFHSGAEQWRLP